MLRPLFPGAKPLSLPRGVPGPGTVVADKYVIDRLIGVGGMGAVLSATRRWDGARVAVKVMLAEEAQHGDSTRRFFREARAAGVIDSPHVAKLLDFGRLNTGVPFMVLELLSGCALDRTIRERAPMPIPEAVDLLLQACEGIAEAHARGIVHRDIKPSNLFVTTGTDGAPLLKVLDFGISKATMKLDAGNDAPSLTETNATLGSPQYMSPEQLRSSKDVDSRTDVWSLGLILFKLLTGRPAFDADNVGAHFAMILADPPAALRSQRPEAPAELEEVILMCLRKKVDERWQDLGQLARALAPFGPPGASQKADRVAAILEFAGVSSQSHPRLSFAPDLRGPPNPSFSSGPPFSTRGPEAPTAREGSLATAAGVRPRGDIGEHTTSAWSPDTAARMASLRPRARMMKAAVIGGALAVAAVVLGVGGYALFGKADPPAHAAEQPKEQPRSDGEKKELLEKLAAGRANAEDKRRLEALCVLDNDRACLLLVSPVESAAPPVPAVAQPAADASEEPKRATRPGSPAPAPAPSAAPAAQPEAVPSSKVKPKGPMEETL
jgi:serine/threonine protein kinase